MKLKLLPNNFAMYKLDKSTDISHLLQQEYIFIGVTPNELSVIIDNTIDINTCISKIDNWKIFELQRTFEFSDQNIWITAKLSSILAKVGISLCFIGTHDTDFILISEDNLTWAVAAFTSSWIEVIL